MTSKRNAVISPEKTKELTDILGFDDDKPPVSGSLEPMNANAKKWSKGLPAQTLSELAEIAEQITQTVDEAVITVARARLRMGKLLNEARGKFKGDNEFGKWRASILPDLATRTATSYMAMATQFKDAPELVDSIGWTAARGLINAPESVVAEVKKKVESGEKPNAESVKKLRGPTHSQSGGADKKPTPPPETIIPSSERKESIDRKIEKVLRMNTSDRLDAVLGGEFDGMDDASKSAIIFGFGPSLCDEQPNMDIWLMIYDYNKAGLDEEGARILDQAYSKMKEAWS